MNDFVQIALLLAKFQILESGIKVVLMKNKIKLDRANNQLKSTYSLQEVDDLSYGVLLKRYKNITEDNILYERLLTLKDYRNFLAHKSFLTILNMSQEMKEFIGVDFKVPFDYQFLNEELDECILIFREQHVPTRQAV